MQALLDYFDRRRREFRRYASGLLNDEQIDGMFNLARDGGAGLIAGRIPLDDRAFVAVHERVVLADGRAVLSEYSYYLVDADAGEVRGYDLDPTHDPAAHRHVGSHENREPWEQVSLREALEDFWDVLNELRSAADEP